MTIKDQPTGVVAIFADEAGNVIATTTDFNRSGYGGFKLHEAQEHRVKHALYWKVVQAYASPQLTRGMEEFHVHETVRRLVHQHGCKITIIHIPERGDGK